MKAILEDEGYLVDLAATGKEAVQKTQEKAYNVALLDIRLPDMEGVELLELMKDSIPRTRKIMENWGRRLCLDVVDSGEFFNSAFDEFSNFLFIELPFVLLSLQLLANNVQQFFKIHRLKQVCISVLV